MTTKKNKAPKSAKASLSDLTPRKDASGGRIPEGGPSNPKYATAPINRILVDPPPRRPVNS